MSVANVRVGLAAVVTVLLVAGVFTACSSTPSEAEQLCSQLDGGMVPIQAIGTMPGADADPEVALARARDAIRSTCPQHEAAAASADAMLSMTGSPEAAPAPAPRGLELRVEGSVADAQVNYSAAGSNSGGEPPQKLPWTRAVTSSPADLVNLSAVSRSGAEGALQCSITDTATGEVLARQNAVADGSSSGYASIVCSAGQFAGPATIAPPIATTAAARPTTTTPRRPVTWDAADAESDRLKSCMVRTGKTEAQCRAADGSDRLPSAAEDPSGNLRACMEQTGMSAAGCRAASARGEGG